MVDELLSGILPRRDGVGLFGFVWLYFILFCFLDELLIPWGILVSKMPLSVYLTYPPGLIHRSSKPVIVQPAKASSLFQTAEFCWRWSGSATGLCWIRIITWTCATVVWKQETLKRFLWSLTQQESHFVPGEAEKHRPQLQILWQVTLRCITQGILEGKWSRYWHQYSLIFEQLIPIF